MDNRTSAMLVGSRTAYLSNTLHMVC